MLLHALVLSLVLAPRQEPNLAAKVTCVCYGLDTPKAVEQLSKAAHVTLTAPKAFESDVIAFRLQDATLKEAMDRIATLTAGEWVKEGEGYQLVRNREKLRKDELAEAEAELSLFATAIKEKKAAVEKLQPFTEEGARTLAQQLTDTQKDSGSQQYDGRLWQKLQKLEEGAPGGRAIARVVANLDAKELAGLPYDYKVVYSDKPTKLQRPLPKGIEPAIQQLVKDQNLWAEVAERMTTDQEGGYYTPALWMKSAFNGGVGKVLLMITKQRSMGNVYANVELVTANQKGVIVVRGNQNISAANRFNMEQPKPLPGEESLKPTALALAMKSRWESMSGGGASTPPAIPKDVLDKLTNPEKFEPLSLSTGESLIQLAEAKKENLVVSLSDEAFQYGFYVGMQQTTPSMYLTLLGTALMNVEEKDGWLTLGPKNPASARKERLDRSVAGRFIRAVQAKGRATLDELANYAIAVDGELYQTLGYSIVQLMSPYQQDMYFEASILRFYGHLTPAERTTLSRGGSLSMNRLSPALSEALNKMIFGQNTDLQPKPKNGAWAEGEFEVFYNGIRREPTEMLANGLPSGSVIKMVDTTSKVLAISSYAAGNGVYYGGRSMDADEIAQYMYAKERPGIFPWIDSDPGFLDRKGRCGSRHMLQFNFEFGDLAMMGKSLQDVDYGSGQEVTMDQLPEDFKKEIEAKLVEMRKNYKDVKPGDFGNGPGKSSPPPP